MVKMSYDDCPLNCNNGKIFDYELRQYLDCPHCASKRKELAKEGVAEMDNGDIVSLPKILGIDNPYLSVSFSYDSVIPEDEKVFLDKESLDRQKEILDEIYLGLSVGELPDKSYCLGLGVKGRVDRLAYPLLAKAYLSGLSVARFISCGEYNRLCINMDLEVVDFYEKDFVMVLIPDGSSKADIASAKGLMQSRALKGKPTIFVTTWVIEACSMLLGYYGEETYFLATGSFVGYKVSNNGKKPSKYINQLTGVENEVYNSNETQGGSHSTNPNSVTMADLL